MKGSGYNKLKAVAYIVAGVGVFLYLSYFALIIAKGDFTNVCDFMDRLYCQLVKNPGDLIGGTVGVLFTLTATIFLFITFKEQRLQFEKTQKDSFYSRFETTYFNILAMLGEVKENVNNAIIKHSCGQLKSLDDYYDAFVGYFKDELERNESLQLTESNLAKDDILPAEILSAEQVVGDIYAKFIKDYNFNIGYYFRYIYNTLKFVYDRNGFKSPKEKEQYTNLLQAQLSDKDLALLFYDAISDYGENKEGKKVFRKMLDDFHFLENIKETVLINREHHLFYPKTNFKFLTDVSQVP